MLKTLRYFLCAISFIVTISSCYDKDAANLDDSLIFTPEYSMPIGFGDFSMEDVVFSPSFDTIPVDTAISVDSLTFEYEGNYYELPSDASYDTTLREDFDFNQIEDWLDNATYLMFRMNLENTIPGGILLQVEFRDASNNPVFSLFDNPGIEIPASPNNQPVIKQEDTYLTSEEINSLRDVTQIYSYIQLTLHDITNGISYNSDQYFKFQMGFRVGLIIDSNEESN